MKAKKILVKNQKGGVGKSLLSLWIAHGITSLLDKTVLLITSDAQDNIPTFAGIEEETTAGLEKWIHEGEGDMLELREGLFYIPLKQMSIREHDGTKFRKFMSLMEERVDYIIIDASPVLELDDLFVDIADKIVIPTFLDEVTTAGILNLVQRVGIRKIAAVVPNRSRNTKLEREYFEALEEIMNDACVLLTAPIRHSSLISQLIDEGKTVWDTKRKTLDPVREEIQKVIEVIS